MSTHEKLEFPRMCRDLRVAHNLKQKDCASGMGIKPQSYGNLESQNHKTVRLDRVHKLARFYSLDDDATARLVAAWEALPVSEYAQRRGEAWAKRNALRGKAKGYEKIKLALVEVIPVFLCSVEEPGTLCACEPGGGTVDDPNRSCELCSALQVLGLPGWTTLPEVIDGLAKIQNELDVTGK